MEKADLVEMLCKMILIREFDERAIQLRTAGKIYGAMHPYVGEEAVAVGVCAALQVTDRVTSTHRGHGHCIAKGADIKRMMAELFGKVDGYCKGKGGSMHIADFAVGMLGANGIVGAGLPIAAGAALAAQLEGQGKVAVCFFGDGAVAEGEFHEALNIASVWKLPLIFVCENNQYAANNAVEVQHPIPDIAALASGYGMPGMTVDGNDVLAVYETTRDAVERARRGDGPTLIECKTYRWHGHNEGEEAFSGPYRPKEEIAEWKGKDPIPIFVSKLVEWDVMKEEDVARVDEEEQKRVEEAVEFAEKGLYPDPEEALQHLFYQERPPLQNEVLR